MSDEIDERKESGYTPKKILGRAETVAKYKCKLTTEEYDRLQYMTRQERRRFLLGKKRNAV